MRIKTKRNQGFTLVEIMIVVAIIGLLAAIAIPNFVRARTSAQANACINNLRQMDGAIQQWALENRAGPDQAVTLADIQPYLGRGDAGALPECPADGNYAVTTVAAQPTCDFAAPEGTPPHVLDPGVDAGG